MAMICKAAKPGISTMFPVTLAKACEADDVETITSWLDLGGPVDAEWTLSATGREEHKDDMSERRKGTLLISPHVRARKACSALLIERKASVNIGCGEYGITPLMEACMQGASGAVHRLLEAGADPSLHTTVNCLTAMDFAGESGDVKVMAMLCKEGPHDVRQQMPDNLVHTLMTAVEDDDVQVITSWLDFGGPVNGDWIVPPPNCLRSLFTNGSMLKLAAMTSSHRVGGLLIERNAALDKSRRRRVHAAHVRLPGRRALHARDSAGTRAPTWPCATTRKIARWTLPGASESTQSGRSCWQNSPAELLAGSASCLGICPDPSQTKSGLTMRRRLPPRWTWGSRSRHSGSTSISNARTLLMAAALINACDVAALLVERKALLDTQNDKGHSAIMLASYRGHADIVRISGSDRRREDGRLPWRMWHKWRLSQAALSNLPARGAAPHLHGMHQW